MTIPVHYKEDKGIGAVTVLLVEDQPALCEMLKSALRRLGFQHLFVTHNGIEAMEILEKHQVDIMITDWVMQGMDGITLTRLVRASKDPTNRYTPIIMMSGLTAEEDIKTARDSGITEFVAKPFTIKHMCDRITAIVEKPRDFVLAPSFKGPDRRRTAGKTVDTDRRYRPEENTPS